MSNIKGTIQSVSCKEGNDHPKYGMSYQTSVKIDGEWYGAFTKKTADELGLEKGKLVSFTWTQNGKYKNFDPKSLAVAAVEEAAAPGKQDSPKASGTYRSGDAGIKVGHAINNAVQIAIANKDTSLKTIHGLAVDIITLSRKLEGQFELIVKRADKLIAEATSKRKAEEQPEEQEQEPEQEEAPAPKPKAKAPVKAAAAAKKPAPKKADPEPEDDEATPQEPETAPVFDDDIPF